MSDSGFLFGNADPGNSGNQSNAIDFAIQQALSKINTATLGKIVTAPYSSNGAPIEPGTAGPIGYVDVLPLINQLDGQGNATPHGTVYRLSYLRYSSGSGAIISDPGMGDIGLLIAGSRDASIVKATNAQGNPASRRKFSLADAVFLPCSQAGAPNQYVAFTASGIVIADKNGNIIVFGPESIAITAPNGMIINGAQITAAGDFITARGVSLNNHVNTGVTAGGDDSGPPP